MYDVITAVASVGAECVGEIEPLYPNVLIQQSL